MIETAKASWLRQGDMLESLAGQVVHKRVHQVEWQKLDVRARVALVVEQKDQVRIVLQDHSSLMLEPEIEVTRSPWEGQFCADCYTEYEVVFEWVEWRPSSAPCGGFFRAVKPAREKSCFVLAIDRRGAEGEARAELGLVEWANETTGEPGWRRKSVVRARPDEPVVLGLDKTKLDEAGQPTGYIVRAEGRCLGEIYRDVSESLNIADLVDEYFSGPETWRSDGLGPSEQWPADARWVACYAVTGGSEGWYWHCSIIRHEIIEVEGKPPRHIAVETTLFLGKTFQGMAHAQKCAAKCAELLGA